MIFLERYFVINCIMVLNVFIIAKGVPKSKSNVDKISILKIVFTLIFIYFNEMEYCMVFFSR